MPDFPFSQDTGHQKTRHGARTGENEQMSSRKRTVRGRGRGSATHNSASERGKLEVTVWGVTDNEPDRKMAIVLDEEAVRQLVAQLAAYGFRSGR
jgi:hypothetical protein